MSSIWKFLYKIDCTSRLSYMLNPFLLEVFLSKMVLIKYLVAPGDAVKSFVKSLLLPYPMPAPFFLMLFEMS